MGESGSGKKKPTLGLIEGGGGRQSWGKVPSMNMHVSKSDHYFSGTFQTASSKDISS